MVNIFIGAFFGACSVLFIYAIAGIDQKTLQDRINHLETHLFICNGELK